MPIALALILLAVLILVFQDHATAGAVAIGVLGIVSVGATRRRRG